MTRRFLMVLLITLVAVLSGRPLLICTMNMAAAEEVEHCAGHEAPAPVDTGCMVEIAAPSGLPSVEQSPTFDVVQEVAYQLSPVLYLSPQFHAADRATPVRYESPPSSIQILRI